MSKFEKLMEKLESVAGKGIRAIRYFSVFGMGMGTAAVLEYGHSFWTAGVLALSVGLCALTTIGIKEIAETEEIKKEIGSCEDEPCENNA